MSPRFWMNWLRLELGHPPLGSIASIEADGHPQIHYLMLQFGQCL